MGSKSDIEWTATINADGSVTPGATWNPVRGCVKVSPGCANCYAETFAERFRGVPGHAYERGFDVRLVPESLGLPLRWTKPRRVFVNSMSDLFQDGVPTEYIDRVFWVMAVAQRHTFQVLTKRADRMRSYLSDQGVHGRIRAIREHETGYSGETPWPLPNVWMGVSVENQHFADERIPLLLQTPAAVRFISAEPLLGPVDLTDVGDCINALNDTDAPSGMPFLDWVIVGGESGHGARMFNVQWARDIAAQCREASVPCFIKQLGAKPVGLGLGEHGGWYPIRSRKGGDMSEWPEDLRVREFPA